MGYAREQAFRCAAPTFSGEKLYHPTPFTMSVGKGEGSEAF